MDWKRKYVTSRILYISYENHGVTSHISALRLLHKFPCAPTVMKRSREEVTLPVALLLGL